MRAAGLAVAVALLAGGCSAGPGQGLGPFDGSSPPPAGDYSGGTVVTGKIYDIGGVLHNYSANRVRLTSVRLVSPAGPGVRVLSVRAYLISDIGGVDDLDEGDLPKICPELFRPHPVTDMVVAPRSTAAMEVIIALIFRKPGRYHFGRLRIGFIANGTPGWQLSYIQNVNATAISSRSAPPGLYNPTRCSGYVAPSVAILDAYSNGHGGWNNGGAGGFLYANHNVGVGGPPFWLGLPGGRYVKEKIVSGTWRHSDGTVSLCLQLAGASPGAPATDRICARGVPIHGTPVKVTDAHGYATLIRVTWIPAGP